jgi:hypothetical protein
MQQTTISEILRKLLQGLLFAALVAAIFFSYESFQDWFYNRVEVADPHGKIIFRTYIEKAHTLRQQYLHLIVSVVLVSLLLLLMWAWKFAQNFTLQVITSALATVLLMSGIGAVYYYTVKYPDFDGIERVMVDEKDNQQLKNEQILLSDSLKQPPPVFVPTGVFIQSIEFTNANNAVVTGYVWQHYDKKLHKGVSRGFILPEAEAYEFAKVYHLHNPDSTETIGWYVNTTIREYFSYQKYPFDTQNLWMRIWHKDFAKNVILSPDFKAYTHLNPQKLPGIDEDIVLPGWHFVNSFFSYNFNSYNSNFGIKDYVGQHEFPELYFNVGIKRDILGPFIKDMMPAAVALILLFFSLFVLKQNGSSGFFQFNVIELLSLGAALIFVLTLSHIGLRENIPSGEVLYMEYIYFIIYAGIFWVQIYSIFYKLAQDRQYKFSPQQGIIVKLIFFPVTMAATFFITAWIFY